MYKAQDHFLKRLVALKQLKNCVVPGGEDSKRFTRESLVLSRLKHPNIVEIYSFEIMDEQAPLIVLEFVEGKSLKALLQENQQGLSFSHCKRLFMQICEAMLYAHSMGVIHRDLSSSNILIVKNSDGGLDAKIIDFGLSKLLRPDDEARETAANKLTRTDSLLGNPAYMSPEACIGGKVDEQSDIYSLACILELSLS